MRQYSLRALAKEVGWSESTLRRWRARGWLKPSSKGEAHERYTMQGFEEACRLSLNPALEQTAHDPTWTRRAARQLGY